MPLLILVAEDDLAIRLSINDYLELNGYSVITAEDGEQALSMVEKYHPHLLISDVKMPHQNGYELIENIRRLPQYRLLPIILLSERSETNDRIYGYQVGCDAYLPKPFELEELGAIIRNLLERSQIVHSELRFSHGNNEPIGLNANLNQFADREKAVHLKELHSRLQLTQRETEVLELLIEGRSNLEIGQQLHLSHRTIEKYVTSLLRKADLSNRVELICYAMEHHLV